ncbi:hypothetical protein JB92DRAFT_3120492 [Gautieria morchelliformis]|nr:hypothetical protein JB92DRAFT_3120492 [Gautieria morchelliformis]
MPLSAVEKRPHSAMVTSPTMEAPHAGEGEPTSYDVPTTNSHLIPLTLGGPEVHAVNNRMTSEDDEDDKESQRGRPPAKRDDADDNRMTSEDSEEDEESPGRMPQTKRDAGPPHAILIPELEKDAGDLSLWTLKGLHAIHKLVADLNRPEPKGVTIPAKIRQLACSIQRFLPEAALTSRVVLRAFLTMSHGNLLCPLHAKFAKKCTVFEEGTRGYWVTGMDRSGPSVNRTRTQAKTRVEGFCHCGCDEDAVLFEFAMWKRWQVHTLPSDHQESQAESLRLALEDWWAGPLTQADAVRVRFEKARAHYGTKLTMLREQTAGEFNCALA